MKKNPPTASFRTYLITLCGFLFSVAPDKVTIDGPKEAKVNDSLHFKCETANSNPPASVQWVVDGRSAHTTSTHSVSKFCTVEICLVK